MNISAALNSISFQTPEAEYLILMLGFFSSVRMLSLPELQSWRFKFSHFLINVNQVCCTLHLSTLTQTAWAEGNLNYFCSITSFPVSILQKQCYCAALPTRLPCIQSCLSLFFILRTGTLNIKKTTWSGKLLFENPWMQNAKFQVWGLGSWGKCLIFPRSMFYQLKE